MRLIIIIISLIIIIIIIIINCWSSIHSSTNLSINPFIHPSTHPSIYLLIHLSIHSSIHLLIHLSIYSSIYLSIRPSIYSSIQGGFGPFCGQFGHFFVYVSLLVGKRYSNKSIHPCIIIHSSIISFIIIILRCITLLSFELFLI